MRTESWLSQPRIPVYYGTSMKNVLVIGGSGFLGSALVRALKRDDLASLRSFDLTRFPDADVQSIVGDLCNPDDVLKACTGVDTVFQTAALVDWGPRSRERLLAVNVLGNRNVIAACQKLGVARLIYTSSIDVVFDGTPISHGDERLPYPKHHLDDYGYSKALAERDVLQANDPRGLQTCSLRAAGIYGPGDRHRFPNILKAIQQGQMIRLGNGGARFNHVYVTNLVEAHLQAARALRPGSPVSGQAYFVTDHEPGNFYDFFTPYLTALGYPIPHRQLPESIAYGAALVMETLARVGIGSQPPLLTRYVVLSTCRDFYFDGTKAQRDFGYKTVVSSGQAFEETLSWLREIV